MIDSLFVWAILVGAIWGVIGFIAGFIVCLIVENAEYKS